MFLSNFTFFLTVCSIFCLKKSFHRHFPFSNSLWMITSKQISSCWVCTWSNAITKQTSKSKEILGINYLFYIVFPSLLIRTISPSKMLSGSLLDVTHDPLTVWLSTVNFYCAGFKRGSFWKGSKEVKSKSTLLTEDRTKLFFFWSNLPFTMS